MQKIISPTILDFLVFPCTLYAIHDIQRLHGGKVDSKILPKSIIVTTSNQEELWVVVISRQLGIWDTDRIVVLEILRIKLHFGGFYDMLQLFMFLYFVFTIIMHCKILTNKPWSIKGGPTTCILSKTLVQIFWSIRKGKSTTRHLSKMILNLQCPSFLYHLFAWDLRPKGHVLKHIVNWMPLSYNFQTCLFPFSFLKGQTCLFQLIKYPSLFIYLFINKKGK